MDLQKPVSKLTVGTQMVSASKNVNVSYKWDEKLEQWIPQIIDLTKDIQSGEIKTTWKTHLMWLLFTILSIFGTSYLGLSDNSTPVVTPVVDTTIVIKDTTMPIKKDSLSAIIDSTLIVE